MTPSDIDQLGLPPGLTDMIKTFDDGKPPEWFNLPVFLFYVLLHQSDVNGRYTNDYITFGQLQTMLGGVYQSGCILGHIQPDKGRDMMTFCMGRAGGDWEMAFTMFKQSADERVNRYQRLTGNFPNSVLTLQILTGYLEAGVDPLRDREGMRSAARQRVPLDFAEGVAVTTFNEGVVYAVTQTELWKNAMINHDERLHEPSPFSDPRAPDMATLIDTVVGLSRVWAELCRPDLLSLIPELRTTHPDHGVPNPD